jgi:hypothetical protein
MDVFACQVCHAAAEPIPDSNVVIVRHALGCAVLISQCKARWPEMLHPVDCPENPSKFALISACNCLVKFSTHSLISERNDEGSP